MRLPVNGGWLPGRGKGDVEVERAEPGLTVARAALRAHVEATRRPREAPRAREAMRTLCDDARRRRLHAEQLLVAVKGAWRTLPSAETGGDERSRQHTLDRFITLCIEEFYARVD